MIIHRLSYTDRFECMFAAFVDRVCAFRIRQYRLSLLRSTTLRVSIVAVEIVHTTIAALVSPERWRIRSWFLFSPWRSIPCRTIQAFRKKVLPTGVLFRPCDQCLWRTVLRPPDSRGYSNTDTGKLFAHDVIYWFSSTCRQSTKFHMLSFDHWI